MADVVAHELAHMWFGDLVTMGWWEGIWLNEAFATFMETACVDAFRPAWQRWVSFGTSREGALAIDGLHATRPIEYPVGSPEEADGMFDVLTYEKGCSVLRMLEQFLGPQVFRDGVREYLRIHSYANTVTADLWSALESVSGQPVGQVMDTWILQGGHPLVTVSWWQHQPGAVRLWSGPRWRDQRHRVTLADSDRHSPPRPRRDLHDLMAAESLAFNPNEGDPHRQRGRMGGLPHGLRTGPPGHLG